MKYFCLCFLLTILALRSQGQSIDSLFVDYYGTDTLAFEINDKKCEKLYAASNKRLSLLLKRTKKMNNYYLHLFMMEEDKLIHSLCNLPVAQIQDDKKLLNIKEKRIDKPQKTFSNNKTIQSSFEKEALLVSKTDAAHINQDISEPIIGNLPSSEARADQLLLDAWYSFNRFENLCYREKDRPFDYKLPALDSLNATIHYLEKTQQCDCNSKMTNQELNMRLKQELKRTELIQHYIQERRTYLTEVLAEVAGGKSLLLPMQKCSHYFNAQLKENFDLFKSGSIVEKKILGRLRSLPGFMNLLNSKSVTNAIAAMPAKSNAATKITIEELLSKAPEKTKELLTSVSSGEFNMNADSKLDLNKLNSKLDDAGQRIEDEKGNVSQANTETTNFKPTEERQEEADKKPWTANPLKTKRIADRFNSFGNFQADPSTKLFPTSGTLSAGLSYQYDKNGSIGIGVSFIQPFPKHFPSREKKISIPASSGYGFRSFIDYKLTKMIFLEGGYESNFREGRQELNNPQVSNQRSELTRFDSALLGLKMKYSSKSKRVKPTVEILYDFLHRETGQPAFVVRMGMDIFNKHSYKS